MDRHYFLVNCDNHLFNGVLCSVGSFPRQILGPKWRSLKEKDLLDPPICYRHIAEIEPYDDSKYNHDNGGKDCPPVNIIKISSIENTDLWNNKDICINWVATFPGLFSRIPDHFCDESFLNKLATKLALENPELIKSVPSKHQTESFCIAAVSANGYALEYIKDQTPVICLAAVKQNPHAICCVETQTNLICKETVSRVGSCLKYVARQTPEICLLAVENDGLSLKFVHEQTTEICNRAVMQNRKAIKYVEKIHKYYTLLKQNITSPSSEYKLGLNELSDMCYSDERDIFALGTDGWLAEITIPDDAKTARSTDGKTWTSNKIVIQYVFPLAEWYQMQNPKYLAECSERYPDLLCDLIKGGIQNRTIAREAVKRHKHITEYLRDEFLTESIRMMASELE